MLSPIVDSLDKEFLINWDHVVFVKTEGEFSVLHLANGETVKTHASLSDLEAKSRTGQAN
ncbi:MAG: hypothetical protein GVY16_07720 [Planctomycetes bacterium]|jgi:hypothetical protein|nr:hypothetical protein [Phycisphaerae bacterium]NBB95614.1 hypothetical protein [Planctomycetota bacterium]